MSARHTQRRHGFRFGLFEARVRPPTAAGVWPAFWLMGEDDRLGWPECGEIDIMEAPAGTRIHGQIHQRVDSPSADGGSSCGVSPIPSAGDWDRDCHTYGVVSRPRSPEFSVAGKPTGVVTRDAVEGAGGKWVLDNRQMTPVANKTVGGWAG